MYLISFEYKKRGRLGQGIITKSKTLKKVETIKEATDFTNKFKHIDEKKYKDWVFKFIKIDK